MNKLSIDIETYSGTPITAGVYRYVEDPDYEILLFGYSVDGGSVQVVDLEHGEKLPEDIAEFRKQVWELYNKHILPLQKKIEKGNVPSRTKKDFTVE